MSIILDIELRNINDEDLFFGREPSPTERQAAMIADLEARLQLLDERLFYVTSELAKADAMIAAMKEDSK